MPFGCAQDKPAVREKSFGKMPFEFDGITLAVTTQEKVKKRTEGAARRRAETLSLT